MKNIFIIGTGKCGESFLNKVLKKDVAIDSYDERRPLLQSYYKFIRYNKLKVDEAPLFLNIKKAITNSNKKKKIYLESSSFLSFHAKDLVNKFNSKIIVLLRNPNDVCKDLQESGWYKNKYYKSNDNSALGYQGISTKFSNKHHNFSRLAPRDKLFSRSSLESVSSIMISDLSNIHPVSRPSSICIIVIPDTLSPASNARSIGAAPLQRGNKEA